VCFFDPDGGKPPLKSCAHLNDEFSDEDDDGASSENTQNNRCFLVGTQLVSPEGKLRRPKTKKRKVGDIAER
jgi:hypothetical protein